MELPKFSQKQIEESITFEICEQDIRGEWRFERIYTLPKDSHYYVSEGAARESTSGPYYYYKHDEFSKTISKISSIPTTKIDSLVAFFMQSLLPKTNGVPSLLEICATYILKTKCVDIPFVELEKDLINRIPHQLIEYEKSLYRKRTIRDVKTEDQFRKIFVKELEINEKLIQQHRSDILAIALKDLDEQISRSDVPVELEKCFSSEKISSIIQNHYKGTSTTSVKIRLPGTPQLTLVASSKNPYLVPWTIEVSYPFMAKPMQFTTYSTEVGRLVFDAFHNTLTPDAKLLLNPAQSVWTSPLWFQVPDIKEPFGYYYMKQRHQTVQ